MKNKKTSITREVQIKEKLPMDLVKILRHRSKFHSPDKGKKVYDRRKVKPIRARDYNQDLALFFI